MSTTLNLYNYFRSSTSYRVRLALAYKNIDYQYVPVNLLKGEQNESDFLKISPMGAVPALQHGQHVIADSMAILFYLEQVFPQQSLLPADAFLRAKCLQICEIINTSAHPYGNLRTLKYLEKNFEMKADAKQSWMNHWISQALTAVESELQFLQNGKAIEDVKYVFGDQLSMADCFIAPQYFSAQRFNVPLEKYPLFNQIAQNIMNTEALKKAHPSVQVDSL